MQSSASENTEDHRKIIDDCSKSMASWFSFNSKNIENYKDDVRFYFGDQWDGRIAAQYAQMNKPTLVIDKTSCNIKKMMGEQKNSDITPIPIPINDEVNTENAELVGGLVKYIMYNSNSQEQFSRTFGCQIKGGWGVLKLYTDYERDDSFDQMLYIDSDNQPINCFFDPTAKKSTKSDGRVCGDVMTMPKDHFEEKYPDATYPACAFLPGDAPCYQDYYMDIAVIVNFYRKEKKKKTLVQLSNGQNYTVEVFDDKQSLETAHQEYLAMMESQGQSLADIPPLEQTNKRTTFETIVKKYKVTAYDVLEETEWPIDSLPLKFVDNDSEWIDGRQCTRSLISVAKDPQRLYNFSVSEIAHSLIVSRREKFWITPKQMQGFENELRNPEQIKGALRYNPDPNAPGPPIPMAPQEVNQSYFQTGEMSGQDIAYSMGMSDPITNGMPAQISSETVGRTIEQQNLMAVNSTQNLQTAMQEIGDDTLKLIPKLFDTQRIITILDADNNAKSVQINHYDEFNNPVNNIEQIAKDIKAIQIKVGCSNAEQRRENFNKMMQIGQAYGPPGMALMGDLLSDETDLPNKQKISARLKTLVPPSVIAEEEGKPPPPPPPPPPEVAAQQAQAAHETQMEQMREQMQQSKMAFDLHLQEMKMQSAQQDNNQKLLQKRMEHQNDVILAHLKAMSETENNKIKAKTTIVKSLSDLGKAQANAKAQSAKSASSSQTLM